jgi:hypothetical protein
VIGARNADGRGRDRLRRIFETVKGVSVRAPAYLDWTATARRTIRAGDTTPRQRLPPALMAKFGRLQPCADISRLPKLAANRLDPLQSANHLDFPRHSFLGRCNGVGTTSDFGTICGFHFPHHVSNMNFNGALAHLQCMCDGLVGFT